MCEEAEFERGLQVREASQTAELASCALPFRLTCCHFHALNLGLADPAGGSAAAGASPGHAGSRQGLAAGPAERVYGAQSIRGRLPWRALSSASCRPRKTSAPMQKAHDLAVVGLLFSGRTNPRVRALYQKRLRVHSFFFSFSVS